ncbi:HNH endonuclease family protein [Planomonospora algeriensis]
MRRVVTAVGACLSALALTSALAFTAASATPPNIPTAGTAATRLAALTVAAESNAGSYDRDLFPHWITITGSCNTREQVLKRDGTNVTVNSSCAATSGSWYSPFDGATWTAASDVDIDHIVPLAEAWRSGAHAWTTAKRQSFANDLGGPELWAMTDDLNQAKGDKDPAAWQPPQQHCLYARAWIQIKYHWGLKLQSAEKTALQNMLATC